MRVRGLLACIVAVVLGVTAGFRPALPVPPPRVIAAPARAGKAAPRPFQSEGAGSCAARACHGGLAPSRAAGSSVDRNEYTTWVTADPHARAYQVLRDDARSAGMIKALGWPRPAYEEDRCLACHATPLGARAPGTPEAVAIRQEGVGCEACHGPSSEWLGAHTRANWKTVRADTDRMRSTFGMQPTLALSDRARTCSGCHVGAPADPRAGFPIARSVDHDMIAAGHPRLLYEFAAYYESMPHHWRPERDAGADFPARAWITGQVATSRAAIALLHDRAHRSTTEGRNWPEFAEYDCYACHHDLRDEAWRRQARTTGWPAWGTWSLTMSRMLAGQEQIPKPAPVQSSLNELDTLMNRPSPDPAAVVAAASAAVRALDAWLDAPEGAGRSGRVTRVEVRRLIERLDPRQSAAQIDDWDQASQIYLGLVPLIQSQKQLAPMEVDPALGAMLPGLYDRLRFPPGLESPGRFDPKSFGRAQ